MILACESETSALLQAHAELRSAESLQALASCFLRQGQPKKAYSILQGNDVTPETRYLLAIACIKLEKPHEAEEALLPERAAREAGPTGSFEKLIRVVPEGAAGLYLLGVACQRLHRPDHAAEYFKLSLRQDPLMWIAYEALCTLGVVVDADNIFSDGGPDKVADATQYQATPTTARRNIFPADDDDSLPTATPFARRNKPGGINSGKIDDSAALAGGFEASGVESPATTLVKAGPAAKALTFTGVDERTVKRPPSKVARRDAVDGGDAHAQEHSVLVETLLRVLKKLGAARQAIAQNRCREALKWLHAVPARHFETGYVLHAVGRANFESADYDAAIEAFRRMERAEPHRMNGLELLSTALWHLKDEVELCYLARRCVEFDPRSPEAWCTAGNCLSLQKEHDAAIRCFHRAIAVDPRFAYAYTLCGHEYVANEDFDKAVAMYRNAMRIDDRHYNAWYGLGAIYYRQEKYELAEYHFQRALNLNPQSSVLHCYLGKLLSCSKISAAMNSALVWISTVTRRDDASC